MGSIASVTSYSAACMAPRLFRLGLHGNRFIMPSETPQKRFLFIWAGELAKRQRKIKREGRSGG